MPDTDFLTIEEKALLAAIVADKFAAGPFSGMVFNAVVNSDTTDEGIKKAVKTALRTRLIMQNLAR